MLVAAEGVNSRSSYPVPASQESGKPDIRGIISATIQWFYSAFSISKIRLLAEKNRHAPQ
jgi:hypothetical protein